MLVVDPDMVRNIPLIESVFIFSDASEDTCFELPETREFTDNALELLEKLFLFCLDEKSVEIPPSHNELFSLVRLADFLGVDRFLDVAAGWLDVNKDAILNHNPIRNVRGLIRGRYRASADKRKKIKKLSSTTCSYCWDPILLPLPQRVEIKLTPCCANVCTYIYYM